MPHLPFLLHNTHGPGLTQRSIVTLISAESTPMIMSRLNVTGGDCQNDGASGVRGGFCKTELNVTASDRISPKFYT